MSKELKIKKLLLSKLIKSFPLVTEWQIFALMLKWNELIDSRQQQQQKIV